MVLIRMCIGKRSINSQLDFEKSEKLIEIRKRNIPKLKNVA